MTCTISNRSRLRCARVAQSSSAGRSSSTLRSVISRTRRSETGHAARRTRPLIRSRALLEAILGVVEDCTGAVTRWDERPEVTLATFITEQVRELGDGLASSLGREEAERLMQRGATLDTADTFEIVGRCLDA